MKKRQSKSSTGKGILTYAITGEFAQEIREYVDQVHRRTGLPKNRIVSNFLLETIRRAKKFYPSISENSESASLQTDNAE